ncbi:hypothetical protein KEM52_003098 [Ascosphaera acerosa]|nr:hypothetical protein KEM52_003098 [Ascosphaera acerosa]
MRASTVAGRDPNAAAIAATPSVKNFDTSIMSHFKRRARKPSILHLNDDLDLDLDLDTDLDVDLDLSAELGSVAFGRTPERAALGSESVILGTPDARDEGTPLRGRRKHDADAAETPDRRRASSMGRRVPALAKGSDEHVVVEGTQALV